MFNYVQRRNADFLILSGVNNKRSVISTLFHITFSAVVLEYFPPKQLILECTSSQDCVHGYIRFSAKYVSNKPGYYYNHMHD
jgi:hypothetical protein